MTTPFAPHSPPAPATYPPPGRLPPAPPPTGATWAITLTILRARARATWNSLRRGENRSRRLIGAVFVALFALLIIGPALAAFAFVVRLEAGDDPTVALRYPPAIFLVISLFLLFSNFPATLNALYFSPTLPLLLAAPVPFRTVFTVALIEGAVAAPIATALAGLALVAVGIGIGTGVAYYLVALVGLLLTVVFVTALTQLIVTAALRVIPARRAREALTLIGAIISVVAYGAYYLSRFGGRPSARGDENTFAEIAARLEPASRVLPPGWAGRAVAAAHAGHGLALAGWLIAATLAAVVFVELAARVFRRAYLVGWSSVRAAAPRRAEAAGRVGRLDRLAAMWSPQVRAVATKEVRTLVRDTKRLSVVVRSAGFALVYLVLFVFGGGGGAGRGGQAFGTGGTVQADAAFWGRAVFVAFVVGGVASGVSAYTFGAEGKQFALYRLAPVSPRTLLFAKWLAGSLIAAPVALVLAVGIGVFLGGGVRNIVLLALFTLWYALGAVANAVATAAIGARFDGERPDRATSFGGTLARLGVAALFFVGSLLLWAPLVYPLAARVPLVPLTASGDVVLRAALALTGAALAAGGIGIGVWAGSAKLRQLLRPVEMEHR